MLPEPDLFASVNNGNNSDTTHHVNICQHVNTKYLSNSRSEHDKNIFLTSREELMSKSRHSEHEHTWSACGKSESPVKNLQLMCQKYRMGKTATVDHKLSDKSSSQSLVDPVRARKWYLVVIVMLYIGLITSFCLNITLLLRNYSPDSNHDSLQIIQLSEGN